MHPDYGGFGPRNFGCAVGADEVTQEVERKEGKKGARKKKGEDARERGRKKGRKKERKEREGRNKEKGKGDRGSASGQNPYTNWLVRVMNTQIAF